jgi:hypothetical protein
MAGPACRLARPVVTRLLAAVAPVCVLAGCGYIGAPLPPALDIPSRVVDLRAAEYGDKILVEFTIPALTTEGLALKSVRAVDLYAGPTVTPFSMDAWAATARRLPVQASGPGPVASDQIPVSDWVGKSIVLAVRSTGPKGKISDWSNAFPLSVTPPLTRPTDVGAENTKEGVKLNWRGAGPHYQVFRAAGKGQAQPLEAPTDQTEFLDKSAQFGTEYRYMVQAVDGPEHQSIVSSTVSITPKDTFPPAVPSGVTAVAGPGTIELAWNRDTEPDFKGYNLYRSVSGGPFEKIASLIAAPSFTDRMVEGGKIYRYEISAVDLLGNESDRSAPVQAAAPSAQ